jgi:hypothetical protein
MHDARHRVMIEKNRITGEASRSGALHSSRVIATVAAIADQVHDASIKQAAPILLDFIDRMQLPSAEITDWARPHLENLGNVLLAEIPPNNLPADHERTIRQYQAVFKQRLEGALRDIEIGFLRGSGFSGMTDQPVDWISAASAAALLENKAKMVTFTAHKTICTRAHDGLIRAHALRFVRNRQTIDDADVPLEFWWARGEKALTQNWAAGDFETWIENRIHLKAYGVTFARLDIEELIPEESAVPALTEQPGKGGRPPADWWEDLLIDLCFKHFRGELQPKTQADIVRAMRGWMTEREFEAADSTVRKRAQKLWNAIESDAEN